MGRGAAVAARIRQTSARHFGAPTFSPCPTRPTPCASSWRPIYQTAAPACAGGMDGEQAAAAAEPAKPAAAAADAVPGAGAPTQPEELLTPPLSRSASGAAPAAEELMQVGKQARGPAPVEQAPLSEAEQPAPLAEPGSAAAA